MARVPIVINTLHGFYFHEHTPAFWRRFFVTMEKVAARCSDVILSQNSEDIQTAVREGICKPELIKPLGNGIDIGRFDRNRFSADLLTEKRRELGLPEGVPVVGFVGRLVREKGILELMEAAVEIRKHVPNVRFLLIGLVDHEKADALTPAVAWRIWPCRKLYFCWLPGGYAGIVCADGCVCIAVSSRRISALADGGFSDDGAVGGDGYSGLSRGS